MQGAGLPSELGLIVIYAQILHKFIHNFLIVVDMLIYIVFVIKIYIHFTIILQF